MSGPTLAKSPFGPIVSQCTVVCNRFFTTIRGNFRSPKLKGWLNRLKGWLNRLKGWLNGLKGWLKAEGLAEGSEGFEIQALQPLSF